MRKNLRYVLLSALAMVCSVALAQTTIGATNNSTAWWTVFSNPYTIEPNKTLTLNFQNFSSKANNWNNWAVVLTEDVAWGTEGSEYVVLRADNYGWHYGQNTADDKTWYTSLSSNFNWDTFKSDMDGSTVVMTVKRVYAAVTIHADITTTSGTKYFEDFSMPCGDGEQNIRAYLTVDNAHIVIDDAATAITDSELPEPITEGTLVGTQDCTTLFWGAHTALNTLEANKSLHMEFTNYTSGVENFHNWVMVVTDGKYPTDADYAPADEYMVLRSDNYGWGPKFSTTSSLLFRNEPIPGFDELTDETAKGELYWSTFRSEMQGAYVIVDVTRWGNSLDILVGNVAQNGAIWYETYHVDNFVDANQPLGVFFTVDHSCMVVYDDKTTIADSVDPTGIKAVKSVSQQGNGVRHNLAGQQVGAAYKGMVIENGRKFIVK